MGFFYIITNMQCGPCHQFKSSGTFNELIKFLFDNIQNVNVYWYELDERGRYIGKEMFLNSDGQITSMDTQIRQNVIDGVGFFPQIIYQRASDGKVFEEEFAANNKSEWERLLRFVETNPDIFLSFDNIDFLSRNGSNNRKSPRSSPRRSPRNSPRKSPRKASPQQKRKLKWSAMK